MIQNISVDFFGLPHDYKQHITSTVHDAVSYSEHIFQLSRSLFFTFVFTLIFWPTRSSLLSQQNRQASASLLLELSVSIRHRETTTAQATFAILRAFVARWYANVLQLHMHALGSRARSWTRWSEVSSRLSAI